MSSPFESTPGLMSGLPLARNTFGTSVVLLNTLSRIATAPEHQAATLARIEAHVEAARRTGT